MCWWIGPSRCRLGCRSTALQGFGSVRGCGDDDQVAGRGGGQARGHDGHAGDRACGALLHPTASPEVIKPLRVVLTGCQCIRDQIRRKDGARSAMQATSPAPVIRPAPFTGRHASPPDCQPDEISPVAYRRGISMARAAGATPSGGPGAAGGVRQWADLCGRPAEAQPMPHRPTNPVNGSRTHSRERCQVPAGLQACEADLMAATDIDAYLARLAATSATPAAPRAGRRTSPSRHGRCRAGAPAPVSAPITCKGSARARGHGAVMVSA